MTDNKDRKRDEERKEERKRVTLKISRLQDISDGLYSVDRSPLYAMDTPCQGNMYDMHVIVRKNSEYMMKRLQHLHKLHKYISTSRMILNKHFHFIIEHFPFHCQFQFRCRLGTLIIVRFSSRRMLM